MSRSNLSDGWRKCFRQRSEFWLSLERLLRKTRVSPDRSTVGLVRRNSRHYGRFSPTPINSASFTQCRGCGTFLPFRISDAYAHVAVSAVAILLGCSVKCQELMQSSGPRPQLYALVPVALKALLVCP
jgi:hypothetical protein